MNILTQRQRLLDAGIKDPVRVKITSSLGSFRKTRIRWAARADIDTPTHYLHVAEASDPSVWTPVVRAGHRIKLLFSPTNKTPQL